MPYVVAEEAWEVGALEVSVGWTWSPFAHLVSEPTAAVPSIFGVVVVAWGMLAVVSPTVTEVVVAETHMLAGVMFTCPVL
jgi:hypothetical protein